MRHTKHDMAIATSPLILAGFCPGPSLLAPENMPAATDFEVGVAETALARTVREGLSRKQKQLPPWLFYDAAGSEIFDRITDLPEYYPTRIERALFQAHAPEMLALAAGHSLDLEHESGHAPRRLSLVELGAGSA